MPAVLDPGGTGMKIEVGEDLGYTYPPMLRDMRPGKKLHDRLVAEVTGRARDAKSAMSSRIESWKKADQVMSAFAPDDLSFNQNLGANEEIKLIIPQGFAVVDTLLSHVMSIYTGGPFCRYRGVGPEDRVKAMLAEIVMDLQFQKSKMLLNVHTQCRDMYVYGLGITSPCWHRQWGKKIVLSDGGAYSPTLGEFIPNGTKVRSLQKGIVWEGNTLENWSPYGYLPDPNRPVQDVQKFQFVGNVSKSDYYELLTLEETEPETYFNVRYLEGSGDMVSEFLEAGEWTDNLRDVVYQGNTGRRIDVLNMYCKLVPKAWGLGRNEYPEIWLFTIAGDRVVIRAQPVDYAHNEYPVTVMAPTYDGYSTAPTSVLEMIIPMLSALDWFFKSHFHNVRKTLNNMFVIDPYLINYAQVANPEPGKVICLREHVWGRGVKDAIEQLNTTDVTRGNVNDAALMMDVIQRVSGAVTQLQGVTETRGERRSATESRDTRMSALNRVSKQAMIASLQGSTSVSRQMLYNTQQFMQDTMFVNLTGRNQMELKAIYGPVEYAEIGPEDLIGDIDIIPLDPAGEGGEYLNEAIQMFQMATTNPETFVAFDSVRMMLDLMRMAGKKNPAQFLKDNFSLALMPNEEVMNRAADGEISPVGARGGQGTEAAQAQNRAPSGTPQYPDVLEGAING